MKNCLIFRGGWEGHDPVPTSELVAEGLRKHDIHVDLVDSMDPLRDPELKTKYDLIVPVWTMGTIGNESERGLLDAVRSGVGVGGWHGGMGDAFRQNTEYQFMVGGQWVAHPGDIVDYRVEITEKENPIVSGIGDFQMHSEQYYMHTDPGNHVLAVTRFSGEHAPWIAGTVMPVVWTRHYGQGRVFYSSLGHTVEDFKRNPQILEITIRGLLWAVR